MLTVTADNALSTAVSDSALIEVQEIITSINFTEHYTGRQKILKILNYVCTRYHGYAVVLLASC